RFSRDWSSDVCSSDLMKRSREFLLVGLGLGLDGHRNDRGGKLHRFELNRIVGVAQGVTGRGVLETNRGHYVPGEDVFDILTVVEIGRASCRRRSWACG